MMIHVIITHTDDERYGDVGLIPTKLVFMFIIIIPISKIIKEGSSGEKDLCYPSLQRFNPR